jgi:hypothetical protein
MFVFENSYSVKKLFEKKSLEKKLFEKKLFEKKSLEKKYFRREVSSPQLGRSSRTEPFERSQKETML